jgi:PHD/YefM family antitoxin component YafN of YafNO toxin-antitoxin module
MKEISAAVCKAKCLTPMEDVRSTKPPLVITKPGKPVANRLRNWDPLSGWA